jgi:4-hydroxy-tetrahydrodipicolinate synthase
MVTDIDARRFDGIYASTICPMDAAGRIDREELARHVGLVAACEGMAGLLVNGHAGENALLSRAEARLVVATAREMAPRSIIVAGVNAENTDDAVVLARDAADAGADALMIFAPFSWALGMAPRAVLHHHRAIHDATDLPIMLFQASVRSGALSFPLDLLGELVRLPKVVGIKEGSWETAAYEAARRLTKSIRPEVGVMASGDEHLMTCFALGSEGSLVSLAALVPELIVGLDRAVRAGDRAAALAMHDRIYPLGRAIYAAAPGGLVAARLKACLAMLGRISASYCKPPVRGLGADETARLAAAMTEAGLGPLAAPAPAEEGSAAA